MITVILQIILLIFALIGLSEVFRLAVIYTINTKAHEEYSYIVIPVCGFCEDIENKIRCSAAKIRWCDCGGARHIVCLDCGMDVETRKICEKTASDYSFISVVDIDEFCTGDIFFKKSEHIL